jgi:hypothetical protein
MGPLVVGSSDCFEPFLASSIPDLEFDGASARLEGPDLEVNTDGW